MLDYHANEGNIPPNQPPLIVGGARLFQSMRTGAWILVFAVTAKVGVANPPSGAEIPGPIRDESRQYAHFMMPFLNEVRRQYVRDVCEIDLIEAAVQGLYEAARQPLPAAMREDVQQAWVIEIITGKYAAAGQRMSLPVSEDVRRIGAFQPLLARWRADLGDHDAVRGIRSAVVSANALKRVLDPYCGFPPPRDFRAFFDQEVNSIGIEFANGPNPVEPNSLDRTGRNGLRPSPLMPERWTPLPSTLLVKTVIAGSPAQRAGIRPGDLVTKIDGQPCSRLNSETYQRLFARTSADSIIVAPNFPDAPFPAQTRPAKVEVHRDSFSSPMIVSLEPSFFAPEVVFGFRRNLDESWNYLIDDESKLGYVRLGSITLLTAKHFQDALQSLIAQNARGLVLDLRWCPGGYLREAMQTAMALLPPDAQIARLEFRNPENHDEQPRPSPNPVIDLPIVVLINGETMGGGELIAAAFQDNRRAITAGERTFGKGSIQQSLNNSSIDGMPFKLTQGTFMRPNGKPLQRFPDSTGKDDWGVRPDDGRWLPLSADAARQIKEQWTLHSLRPGTSRDALATDDPENDPQLRAALMMLRAKIKR